MFTQRLADSLNAQNIRAEITWLPHRAEYAPWTVPVPPPPPWANIAHVNTCLHPRFIPRDMPVVVTMFHVVHDPGFAPYRTRAQALYHQCWIKPLEAAVLRRANLITATSEYTAKQAHCVFGIRDVAVLPSGVDTDLFRPGADRPPNHPFRLLFVGNWSRRKGADLLPTIFERLGPDYELWTTAGLRDRATASALPPNIRVVGRVETTAELVKLYQESDMLLMPSRLEGFGLSALEAMSCGLPVLATESSALPELVKHGINGFLCPVDGREEIIKTIQNIQQNPARLLELRRGARAFVLERFEQATVALDYAKMYSRLALTGLGNNT